jgi:hypothetical protein
MILQDEKPGIPRCRAIFLARLTRVGKSVGLPCRRSQTAYV